MLLIEVVKVNAPGGTLSVLDSACWLAGSKHVALSVATPRPAELNEKNGFVLGRGAFDLFIREALTGRLIRRTSGVSGAACGAT